MSELAVIIDMDKTVVPTWDFMSDVAQALDDGFEVSKDQFYGDVDSLHIAGVDNLRHYDFFAHVRELGLDADEVEGYILQVFKERDYVYDDVSQFLDFLLSDVRPDLATLLTYGERRFQYLKYKCAPTLGSLTCIDILEPKGKYIEEHFAGYRGVVIDDKPIAGLPANFQGVLLERDALPSDTQRYSSLSQVKERWPDIVHALASTTPIPP